MTIKEKHSGKICSAICQFKVTVIKTRDIRARIDRSMVWITDLTCMIYGNGTTELSRNIVNLPETIG